MRSHNTSMPARNRPQDKLPIDLSSMTEEQRLFERLFGAHAAEIAAYEAKEAARAANSSSAEHSMEDDGGVYLQISNLDQYYDEPSMRSYLMNQMKPITPILMLVIDTPSIARVKVPSIQVSECF